MKTRELEWIIYLADGRKKLLIQSEWEKILENESVSFDGSEITSAVREDCDCFLGRMG